MTRQNLSEPQPSEQFTHKSFISIQNRRQHINSNIRAFRCGLKIQSCMEQTGKDGRKLRWIFRFIVNLYKYHSYYGYVQIHTAGCWKTSHHLYFLVHSVRLRSVTGFPSTTSSSAFNPINRKNQNTYRYHTKHLQKT